MYKIVRNLVNLPILIESVILDSKEQAVIMLLSMRRAAAVIAHFA